MQRALRLETGCPKPIGERSCSKPSTPKLAGRHVAGHVFCPRDEAVA
jgi:hypothetical protein